jgi:hypothetical protein
MKQMMKAVGDFRNICFLFSEKKLNTRSQNVVAFQLSICVCLKHDYFHKTMLTPNQMTIPVSSLLGLGGS